MARAHAAYIVVYCVAVLVVLLAALFGYRAWQQYRRTLREVLQRRRDRELESGGAPHHREDYWQGAPPPRLVEVVPEARLAAHSPSSKPIAPLLQPARAFRREDCAANNAETTEL